MPFVWQKTADSKCGPLRGQDKKTNYVVMKMVQRTKSVSVIRVQRESQEPRTSTHITGQLGRGLATASPAWGSRQRHLPREGTHSKALHPQWSQPASSGKTLPLKSLGI